MTSRGVAITLGLASALGLVVASCGAGADDMDSVSSVDGCTGAECGEAGNDASPDQVQADVYRPPVVEDDGGVALADLCGSGCRITAEGLPLYPGDPDACQGVAVPAAGGAGGAGGEVGCSVVRSSDGEPEARCLFAGTGRTGDPCVRPSDCAPGLACVGQDSAGQCRPYCCSDPETCAAGTFCVPRPLLERASESPSLNVPVCVEAHDCRLGEPYPCPEGDTCTCPDELACSVVRADGTTGCVPPGTGTEGEPCPCATASETSLGFVCSEASRTCVKLCAVGAGTSGCDVGSHCQASAALPDGFGVCTTS